MQLGHLGQVALAGEGLDLLAQGVDFKAHLRAALGCGFFGFPDFVQICDLFLQAGDFFVDERKALERGFVFFFLDGFTLNLQLNQPAVELVHDLGLGVKLDLDFGRRLVDQVNRLVRQKAVGDVAVAQFGRSHDGRVGDVDTVVHLIALFEAAQNRHRGFHGWLAHQYLLKAALQCGVFFDVLAVFVQRGGAHAMQLAARQCGFEHIARVHGAFGLARAHHGVQLVNKDDGLAFVLGQVFEHVFQALFKLAAKLGTRQERGHVQRQHALALERIGHFTGHDALGQALNDRGFAHAGLTNEHRVVLGAALQHLNGAADFVVAANDRVELAHAGALGQVHAVFL